MKPVTAGDVARFASGRITDSDEEDRIFHAILERPELEELYFLLKDGDGDDTEGSEPGSATEPVSSEVPTRLCCSTLELNMDNDSKQPQWETITDRHHELRANVDAVRDRRKKPDGTWGDWSVLVPVMAIGRTVGEWIESDHDCDREWEFMKPKEEIRRPLNFCATYQLAPDSEEEEQEEEQEGEAITTTPWGYLVTIVSDCTILFFFFFLFLFLYLYHAKCLDLEKTAIENGYRQIYDEKNHTKLWVKD